MILTDSPKLNIVCGHYGSGKTNVAVNLALDLRKRDTGLKIYAADLDIVNPYFRTADAAEILRGANVEPLIPEFANTNVDIPSLPPKMMGLMRGDYADAVSILDVGGDDGAVVLGMYSASIRKTGRSEKIPASSCCTFWVPVPIRLTGPPHLGQRAISAWEWPQ